MMRIILFLATNMAISVVIGIVFNLLGLSGVLDAQGVNLDLTS
ncbi:MAG: zinc metalloprotease HtpX, partial [Methylococcaceae bacterium]|nr:zinc metalloprotease HtpX [Methylococcaceae bacterium]